MYRSRNHERHETHEREIHLERWLKRPVRGQNGASVRHWLERGFFLDPLFDDGIEVFAGSVPRMDDAVFVEGENGRPSLDVPCARQRTKGPLLAAPQRRKWDFVRIDRFFADVDPRVGVHSDA